MGAIILYCGISFLSFTFKALVSISSPILSNILCKSDGYVFCSFSFTKFLPLLLQQIVPDISLNKALVPPFSSGKALLHFNSRFTNSSNEFKRKTVPNWQYFWKNKLQCKQRLHYYVVIHHIWYQICVNQVHSTISN